MRIEFQVVTFDAADLEEESAFWAGVLGGDVDRDDDWHMVIVDGEPRVGVQHAPDHVPPDWPHGSPPQQVHLDLWVYADPAGHPFVSVSWREAHPFPTDSPQRDTQPGAINRSPRVERRI